MPTRRIYSSNRAAAGTTTNVAALSHYDRTSPTRGGSGGRAASPPPSHGMAGALPTAPAAGERRAEPPPLQPSPNRAVPAAYFCEKNSARWYARLAGGGVGDGGDGRERRPAARPGLATGAKCRTVGRQCTRGARKTGRHRASSTYSVPAEQSSAILASKNRVGRPTNMRPRRPLSAAPRPFPRSSPTG